MSSYHHDISTPELYLSAVRAVKREITSTPKSKRQGWAIACRGISGIAVAMAVGHALDMPIIVVRKDCDDQDTHTHGGTVELFGSESNEVGFANRITNYVIVDDFVSSGRTCQYIERALKGEMPNARCIGVFAYARKPQDCFFPLKLKQGEVPVNGLKGVY